jgi:putative colanic acid biosynthesis acetyltransferase WcaF
MHVDVSGYQNRHGLANKVGRLLWRIVWLYLFRTTPDVWNFWRIMLLRMFGAQIGKHCVIKASCSIWAPWNLRMGDYSCLSFDVDCYSVAPVYLGSNVTVSQYTFLCTASHDITDPHMALIMAQIRIEDGAWVAAKAFVGPGVTVGVGAVVGACAVVTRDVVPWTVVGGNPARFIKKRVIINSNEDKRQGARVRI